MKPASVPKRIRESTIHGEVRTIGAPEGMENEVGAIEALIDVEYLDSPDPQNPARRQMRTVPCIRVYFSTSEAENEALTKGGLIEVTFLGASMPPAELGVILPDIEMPEEVDFEGLTTRDLAAMTIQSVKCANCGEEAMLYVDPESNQAQVIICAKCGYEEDRR